MNASGTAEESALMKFPSEMCISHSKKWRKNGLRVNLKHSILLQNGNVWVVVTNVLQN